MTFEYPHELEPNIHFVIFIGSTKMSGLAFVVNINILLRQGNIENPLQSN